LRRIFALLAFPIAGFVWSIGYLFLMGRILGRGDLAMVGAVVTFPVFGFACGLVWLTSIAFLERGGTRLSALRAIGLALCVAVIAGLVLTGPRGFTLAPGAELFNVFLLLIVGTGAFVAWRIDGERSTQEPATN
jgi:hypothetical protein